MPQLNNTPLDVEKIASGYSPAHFQTIARKNFMGIELDGYSLALFISGLIFIVSVLVWGYVQFLAK